MRCGIYARDGFSVAQALAEGCRKAGFDTFTRSLNEWKKGEIEPFDLVFVFGLRGNGASVLQAYPDAYVVDYGYLRRVMGEQNHESGHWQISHRGLNRPTQRGCSGDRFYNLGLNLKPMRGKTFPRVLCAQHVGDAAHPFDSKAKLYEWARSVPHDEYRAHPWDTTEPLEPLPELLDRAGTIVTWNSTVGIDALLAGVPVEAHGPACYKDIGPKDRLEFFLRLAYSQWTMAEMLSGQPIERIMYEREEDCSI